MQLRHLETCWLPALKEPTRIKWLVWTTLVQSSIECLNSERERPMSCYMPAVLREEFTLTSYRTWKQESLKQFIASRGRPERIYSDNGQTFVGAANWIRAVMKDKRLQTYLTINQIKWQFNLSSAPWWGGQFEWMIGLVKSTLNKTTGNGLLWWKELQEVLLDVEITLNNRPLSYVEDDVQMPLLTPNAMLFLNSNLLPELQPHHIETADLRKRAKHLLTYKDATWSRWTKEYLRSLRERQRAQRWAGGYTPAVGDVVIVKTEDKNRGKWPLGIIASLIVGNDGVVGGTKLRAGKSYMERAIQQLYPLELPCDR